MVSLFVFHWFVGLDTWAGPIKIIKLGRMVLPLPNSKNTWADQINKHGFRESGSPQLPLVHASSAQAAELFHLLRASLKARCEVASHCEPIGNQCCVSCKFIGNSMLFRCCVVAIASFLHETQSIEVNLQLCVGKRVHPGTIDWSTFALNPRSPRTHLDLGGVWGEPLSLQIVRGKSTTQYVELLCFTWAS